MKKIIINDRPWQTRIAITKDKDLQNIYFSSHTQESLERTFFKGIVTKVLPGIQTAFVDIGQEKSGFLHISEIDRELAIENMSKHVQIEEDGTVNKKPRTSRQKLSISKIVKEGDPILVQVSKEPVYEKGAKLTTCFTLPGRFFVLMPNIPRLGVSKKIEDRDERMRLKDLYRTNLLEGMGGIIRTTSIGRDQHELIKDLKYLIKTWDTLQKKFETAQPKELIYKDLPLSFQIVRDHLDKDVEVVITDNKANQQELYRFVKVIAPDQAMKIQLYESEMPLFEKYGIEKQIEAALNKKVSLHSGGSLVIESAEAMTVIDVNTGRFIGKANLEDTILKTNLEAAEEIARQLRLRNIGGLIVIDFIDMSTHTNRQKLFNHVEKSLKMHDKFQSVVLKVSEFGLVQMTRKRSGKTLMQQLMETCHTCHGLGVIDSIQSESFHILREIENYLTHNKIKALTVALNADMFEYMSGTEYDAILNIEKKHRTQITLSSTKDMLRDKYKIIKK